MTTRLNATPRAQLEPAPSRAGGRLASLDLVRGLAILSVVILHLSANALGEPGGGGAARRAIEVLNRSLHFVVPTFLFLTALVHTRSSLARPFSTGAYYRTQIRRTLIPYLVWSALYAVFAVWQTARTGHELIDPNRWRLWLLNGKAYYHLYFLAVALQFYAAFPLVRLAFRRPRPVLPTVLALIGLQAAVYALNLRWWHSPFVASLAPWYVLPLGLGALTGAAWPAWPAFWRRFGAALAVLAALALAWFLPQALAMLEGRPVSTLGYAAAFWAYTSLAPLVLLGLAGSLGTGAVRLLAPLGALGERSLQVYLIHPAVIALIDRVPGLPGQSSPAGAVGGLALAIGLPLLLNRLVEGSALSRLLFGR